MSGVPAVVLPAHAGMFPLSVGGATEILEFSLHTQGCSAQRAQPAVAGVVLPAHVGMFHSRRAQHPARGGSPCTRTNVPEGCFFARPLRFDAVTQRAVSRKTNFDTVSIP